MLPTLQTGVEVSGAGALGVAGIGACAMATAEMSRATPSMSREDNIVFMLVNIGSFQRGAL
jgi:hypothetical protein